MLQSPETDKQAADAKANYWLQLVTDRRDRQLVTQGVIARQTADNQHAMMLQALAAYQQMKAYEVIEAPVSGLLTGALCRPRQVKSDITDTVQGL